VVGHDRDSAALMSVFETLDLFDHSFKIFAGVDDEKQRLT
jgi:hypothetical protein